MEEAAQCGVKIEVIDETAVIDTTSTPVYETAVIDTTSTPVCEYSEGNNSVDYGSNYVVKQETDGKKEKRNRRRGKGGRKLVGSLGTTGQETRLVNTAHVQNGFSKKAERTYSREEIEALRFVNLEAQQKKWVEVYCGLAPNVVRDYDGLIDSNNQNHIQINFDPRQQYGKKEKKIHGVLGDDMSCSQVMDDEIGDINTLDPACDHSVGAEGQCGEEDDSDEDYCSIQRPAFFVTGEPNFDAGPPQDGLEYLRRVRWEAAQVPKVKVAKLERSKLNKEQTAYMPIIPDIEKCPEHLLPMKQWEDAFMADFSELRLAVSRLEDSRAEISAQYPFSSTIHPEESSNQLPETIFAGNFDKLTNGGDEPSEALDCSAPESPDYPQPVPSMNESNAYPSLVNASSKTSECGSSSDSPTLLAVLGMDSKARLSMLRRRIRLAENMTTLSRNDCAWLFALCATIDTPLDADTCAALRCLLRKCASLRAGKLVLDDEVVMLNILATITGKYFGQSEC